MRAKEADWGKFYEPFGGDRYRKGPSFEKNLNAGVYKIEVSTPDNLGKYVLAVGNKEEGGDGYLGSIRRIAEVKIFFGKSQFAVIQSPFVYVPLSVLITVLVVFVFILRFYFSKKIY